MEEPAQDPAAAARSDGSAFFTLNKEHSSAGSAGGPGPSLRLPRHPLRWLLVQPGCRAQKDDPDDPRGAVGLYHGPPHGTSRVITSQRDTAASKDPCGTIRAEARSGGIPRPASCQSAHSLLPQSPSGALHQQITLRKTQVAPCLFCSHKLTKRQNCSEGWSVCRS